ncbi:MAG: hypothetical protein ACKOOL_06575 [Novosphingobium sp.]
MDNVLKSIRLVIAGLVLVPMALAASCSLMGVGTVYALKEAVGDDRSEEARAEKRRERRREELREHNEQMNREAAYGPSRYGSGYDEDD